MGIDEISIALGPIFPIFGVLWPYSFYFMDKYYQYTTWWIYTQTSASFEVNPSKEQWSQLKLPCQHLHVIFRL